MYNAKDLRKGLKIEINGEPYMVVTFEFAKPGKGKSYYKCKLKNMITGSQFDKTFRSGDKFEKPELKEETMEYLYSDGEGFHFMNKTTYEQETLSEDSVGEQKKLMKENTTCTILFYNGAPISLDLPNFVELEVTKTNTWIKGDTATKDTKPATLETGLSIQVPPFIEEGEIIKVDTRTSEYSERLKT